MPTAETLRAARERLVEANGWDGSVDAEVLNACGERVEIVARRYRLWSRDSYRWCVMPSITHDCKDALRFAKKMVPQGKVILEYDLSGDSTARIEVGNVSYGDVRSIRTPGSAISYAVLSYLIEQEEQAYAER